MASSPSYQPAFAAFTSDHLPSVPNLGDPRPRLRAGVVPAGTTSRQERPTFRLLGPEETALGAVDVERYSRDSLEALLELRRRWRADAMLDPLGMFLLEKIADADAGVLLTQLDAYLDGAPGWVAISRLVRAGLLDENGRSLYATPSGRAAAEQTRALSGRI